MQSDTWTRYESLEFQRIEKVTTQQRFKFRYRQSFVTFPGWKNRYDCQYGCVLIISKIWKYILKTICWANNWSLHRSRHEYLGNFSWGDDGLARLGACMQWQQCMDYEDALPTTNKSRSQFQCLEDVLCCSQPNRCHPFVCISYSDKKS